MIRRPGLRFSSELDRQTVVEGWLNIGLCGHQPPLAESYISVPSQYLACFVFPPPGLPPEHPFWSGPDESWTRVKLWEQHRDLPADHALRGRVKSETRPAPSGRVIPATLRPHSRLRG